jgi:hypothetical protein
MGVNREKPHVFVLPEDDANHQLATGFALGLDQLVGGRFKVLPVARGWIRVLDLFLSDHVAGMRIYPEGFMILLVDFDGDGARLQNVHARIPSDLVDRVFVLGSWLEPQDLTRSGLGSYEEIGLSLAQDCSQRTNVIWDHSLLRHNADELARLRQQVQRILFP